VAKVGTSNPDRTISLKRLQCVVENNNNNNNNNNTPPGEEPMIPIGYGDG
jgi:hypothetical protein